MSSVNCLGHTLVIPDWLGKTLWFCCPTQMWVSLIWDQATKHRPFPGKEKVIQVACLNTCFIREVLRAPLLSENTSHIYTFTR